MFGHRFFGARFYGPRYWGDGGDIAPPIPPEAPAVGGGGWLPHDKKRRYGLIPPRTKEQLAALVKAQREALGILPKPAQKRIVSAAKKAAARLKPLEELVPVVVEVAQQADISAPKIAAALQAVYAYRNALHQADEAIQRAEREEQARVYEAEQTRQQAEAEEHRRQQFAQLLMREDAMLIEMDAQAQRLIAEGLRQVQLALMAFVEDSGIAAPG